ncbi:MAG: hypothetical protein L0220_04010 [Acidobacteria bacterium]|nr:hypothetical protein [Acidobacteriota bacterium]
MCLNCYGTGVIDCQVCGGTGVMPNSSLLGEDCLKCKGLRLERCGFCNGTGFINDDVSPLPPPDLRFRQAVGVVGALSDEDELVAGCRIEFC